MTAKEIREKRAAAAAEIRRQADALAAQNEKRRKANKPERDFTATEQVAWKRANAEYDRLSAELQRVERLETIEAEQRERRTIPGRDDTAGRDRADVTPEMRSRALAGWFAEQSGMEPTEEQREAAAALRFNLRSKELVIPLPTTGAHAALQRVASSTYGARRRAALEAVELRDMVVGAGPSGGYMAAPEELIRRLEIAMLDFGGIYENAEIIRTENANPMSWPSANDTGNTGEWLAEKGPIGTTSVDPSVGKTTWLAHKVSSKPIKVSFELLRDVVFDLPGQLGAMLGERIGRAKATAFCTGDGAGKPLGLSLSTTLGVTAASASVITLDEVLDLIHSVDRAYRGEGCGFVMKDSTVLHFRKKKDGDGQYQWRAGLEAGAPDTLWGYPVYTSAEMPTIDTAVKAIIFGQLRSYKVREVGAIRLYRLSELYRENDEDGFVAFHECDAGLLDAGTHPVKHLLMA